MQPAVSIDHLVKRFDPAGVAGAWRRALGRPLKDPIVALDAINVRVQRGEVYGIVGSNGSGKSTLARVIATLLLPDSGSVQVFGHDVVREARTVRRFMNRVSVEASFFKKLSPLENLSFTARIYGLPAGEAAVTLETALLGHGPRSTLQTRGPGLCPRGPGHPRRHRDSDDP